MANEFAFETLQVTDDGPVRIVTISRPKALNALNEQVVAELTDVIEQTADNSAVRAMVLTGAGDKAFVAGADIKAMADMSPEQALVFAGRGHAVGELLASLSIPVIAAVGGFALGGGCELALACDFIYASERARFGQPEVSLGVIPGFGGTQRLLRRVGLAHALELCMTGALIKADEALRLGLVNRVVAPELLLETAIKTAQKIAKMGPLAVAKVKEVLHQGASKSLEEGNLLEQQAFAGLFSSADQREGMAAFMAKREAAFKGV